MSIDNLLVLTPPNPYKLPDLTQNPSANMENFIPFNFFASGILDDILKYILIFVLLIYLVVAMMLIKQIRLMTSTIKTSTTKYIYTLAFIHLIAVFFCLVFVIFIY